MSSQPPNHYTPEESVDYDAWYSAVRARLTEGGLQPDAICMCYKQDCGDREQFMDYSDAGIGAYRGAKFLRLVTGHNNDPGDGYQMTVRDLEYAKITKIIMRKRSLPPWQQHVRTRDGLYPNYEFYFQTRVYTRTDAAYAPKEQESTIRLLEARYVFDWLREHTGAECAEDMQEQPLEGYPEGV